MPVLLGGIQLPAGARVRCRPDSRARARRQGTLGQGRPRIDRALRPSRNRADPDRLARDGLLDQSGVAAPRRSDAADRRTAAAKRREVDHDRARSRIRPSSPRDQQDGYQRRDPARGRGDLRRRNGQPQAVLHDRPADRNRRGPRRHTRPHGADARDHAEARAGPRTARPHRRQREPADPEAGHRLSVAADGGSGGHRSQGEAVEADARRPR